VYDLQTRSIPRLQLPTEETFTMTKLLARTLILASISLSLGACAGNKACCDDTAEAAKNTDGKVSVVNTMCPIGEDDFGSKERSADLARTWNGKSIGFCCESCAKQFDKMTSEKKDAVATAASANKAL
jgi:hypothetical protein